MLQQIFCPMSGGLAGTGPAAYFSPTFVWTGTENRGGEVMEREPGACERLKLELAVKQSQLEALKVKARLAAAEVEARFAEDIDRKEREVLEVKKRLLAAGYGSDSAAVFWAELRESAVGAARAVASLLRHLLDRM